MHRTLTLAIMFVEFITYPICIIVYELLSRENSDSNNNYIKITCYWISFLHCQIPVSFADDLRTLNLHMQTCQGWNRRA